MANRDALLDATTAAPITVQCAWCKVIIHDHRTADRSHGICSECKARVLRGKQPALPERT